MKLENINSLSPLEDNEGSVVSICMIRTFFSTNLHLLVFSPG